MSKHSTHADINARIDKDQGVIQLDAHFPNSINIIEGVEINSPLTINIPIETARKLSEALPLLIADLEGAEKHTKSTIESIMALSAPNVHVGPYSFKEILDKSGFTQNQILAIGTLAACVSGMKFGHLNYTEDTENE